MSAEKGFLRILEEESSPPSYLEKIEMKSDSIIEVIEKSLLNDLITIKVNGKAWL
ncbi:MAG: hypothetical protein QXR62_01960 [Candidatus Bathyarchaeia archaeon]